MWDFLAWANSELWNSFSRAAERILFLFFTHLVWNQCLLTRQHLVVKIRTSNLSHLSLCDILRSSLVLQQLSHLADWKFINFWIHIYLTSQFKLRTSKPQPVFGSTRSGLPSHDKNFFVFQNELGARVLTVAPNYQSSALKNVLDVSKNLSICLANYWKHLWDHWYANSAYCQITSRVPYSVNGSVESFLLA